MSVPSLNEEQRRQARTAATQARRRRAEVKAALRAGRLTLQQVLELAAADDVVARTKVKDVLRCLPRVGEVRAEAAMERLQIAANRRLRGLGRHQVAALVADFS